MNSVCCCRLSGPKKFLEEGDPVTYVATQWIRPLADMAKTSLLHVPGHEHFTPTNIHEAVL